jgi:hypothetical protein
MRLNALMSFEPVSSTLHSSTLVWSERSLHCSTRRFVPQITPWPSGPKIALYGHPSPAFYSMAELETERKYRNMTLSGGR